MPDITLLTRDGTRFEFPFADADNVVDAAKTAGLHLPAMCHEGTCGACHAEVTEGRYTLGQHGAGARADTPTGGVPLCRCRAEGDLVIKAPYAQTDIRRQQIPQREATIVDLTPAGNGAMAVTLALAPDPAFGAAADFVPGQYMEVLIPGTTIRRAYSMANLPNWDGRLEFLIRLVPGGAFTTWLAERARPGDRLQMRGPLGRFMLDETSARPRCLIGGGCGFAPVLSMLRHLAEFQDMQPTTLIFAANREDELFAAGTISDLAAGLADAHGGAQRLASAGRLVRLYRHRRRRLCRRARPGGVVAGRLCLRPAQAARIGAGGGQRARPAAGADLLRAGAAALRRRAFRATHHACV